MPEDSGGLSALDLDFAAAGRLGIEHLAELGHRDVAIIGSTTPGTSELSWSVRFHEGAEAAAAEHGVRVRTWAGGATVGELDRWLEEKGGRLAETSAIVLLNVALIEPLFRPAARNGVRIPDDLSVLVLASAGRLARLYPSLTLLDVPEDAMLDAAVKEILRIMRGAPPGNAALLPAPRGTRIDRLGGPRRGPASGAVGAIDPCGQTKFV